MELIAGMAVMALLFFIFAKRDEKKLDQATDPAQAMVHGNGACGFMVLATLAVIGALVLLLGQVGLPQP